ncbi:patatin-like phospholipase domain-containing protein 2 isoform X2 [Acyrthosiphon pisum]|uniref:PNPLA domain-containing protein n=1 Tax=Acyrthosiphon pisum TaxID=7029 RepID=A0A8R2JW13_ACYPI|nr:patatin-like phospholipase domain-containing protein 2 isoform X2 [Acyrthosiphon pisum]|eukprot:XP_016662761.1 PREDICTED: patatin-like phospholipase domain-containing protein 2 isoform X3 [Acyrthosiphon pisum]
MNISFSGCGFLGIYHIGVASCLKTYAPYLLENKICGSSAGAISACCLLCDIPLELMTSQMLDIVRESRSKALGPFSPSMNITEHLYNRLNKDLPDDAHKRVSGKLFVSLTRVPDGKNVIMSQFSSKEEVIQVLLASAFIPVFSGFVPPLIGKYRYIDGGFTDNLPIVDKNTITISPFSGLTDICPRDNPIKKYLLKISNNSFEMTKTNCFRVARIMFPPEPEMLAKLCYQGFDDALMFLQKNNLINCKMCLIQRYGFILSKNNICDMAGYNPSCIDCKWNNAFAKVQGMPYFITYTLDRYIDSHNSIFNGLLKSKGMLLVKLFTQPYIAMGDLACEFVLNEKGLEFIDKILSYSCMPIETHGKDSPYYYYYNKRHEYKKCIKCSQNCIEYFINYSLTASSVTIDSNGYTSSQLSQLNLHGHQIKSTKTEKHCNTEWKLSLISETSTEIAADETLNSMINLSYNYIDI